MNIFRVFLITICVSFSSVLSLLKIFHSIASVSNATPGPFYKLGIYRNFSAAIFIQVGYPELWNDMLTCSSSVVSAANLAGYKKVDIYVSLVENASFSPDFVQWSHNESLSRNRTLTNTLRDIKSSLERLEHVGAVKAIRVPNGGGDVRPFISTLNVTLTNMSDIYDLVLKIHTKADPLWRERALESLCGTKEQVLSVMRAFQQNEKLDMIAPLGTYTGPLNIIDNLFPHLVRKYRIQNGSRAFDLKMAKKVNRVYQLVMQTAGEWEIPSDDLSIVCGTMFWIRYTALQVDRLVAVSNMLDDLYSKRYAKHGALEHVMERFFSTAITARKRQVAEIAPCPRILALHSLPLHNFNSIADRGLYIEHRLDSKELDRKVGMARKAGLSGLVYKHSWSFSDPIDCQVKLMNLFAELVLNDVAPKMPFAVMWRDASLVENCIENDNFNDALSNDYENKSRFFQYLKNLFLHPNYIKLYGKPVLVVSAAENLSNKIVELIRKTVELPDVHIFWVSDELQQAVFDSKMYHLSLESKPSARYIGSNTCLNSSEETHSEIFSIPSDTKEIDRALKCSFEKIARSRAAKEAKNWYLTYLDPIQYPIQSHHHFHGSPDIWNIITKHTSNFPVTIVSSPIPSTSM